MAAGFAFPLVILVQTISFKMLKKIRALSYECRCSSVDGAYSGVEEPGVNFFGGLVMCLQQPEQVTYSSISNWSGMSADKTRRDPVNILGGGSPSLEPPESCMCQYHVLFEDHRTTEWLRLERTYGDYLAQNLLVRAKTQLPSSLPESWRVYWIWLDTDNLIFLLYFHKYRDSGFYSSLN